MINPIKTLGKTTTKVGNNLFQDISNYIVSISYQYIKSQVITTARYNKHHMEFSMVHTWLKEKLPSKSGEVLIEISVDHARKKLDVNTIPWNTSKAFKFKGYIFWVNTITPKKIKRNSMGEKEEVDGVKFLTINMLGKNKKVFKELLRRIFEPRWPYNNNAINIFVANYNSWKPVGTSSARRLNSVILKEGLKEEIIQDIETFRKSEQWYEDIGIPFRRGYLLIGPPGNGKTSLVTSLAGALGMDIYILSLNTYGLNDNDLLRLMMDLSFKSIVLLEDVDTLFNDGKFNSPNISERITFSGFLNAIDGAMNSNGRILFMTTNKPAKVNKTLVRPGRVDRQIEIGYPEDNQIERIYYHIVPRATTAMAKEFIKEIRNFEIRNNTNVSMAMLQEHLVRTREDKNTIIKTINDIEQAKVVKTYQSVQKNKPHAKLRSAPTEKISQLKDLSKLSDKVPKVPH